MNEILINLKPIIFTSIGVAVLFYGHSKNIKKWQKQKPVMPKNQTIRLVLSMLLISIFAFVLSSFFTRRFDYLCLNTLGTIIIISAYLFKVMRDLKTYAS